MLSRRSFVATIGALVGGAACRPRVETPPEAAPLPAAGRAVRARRFLQRVGIQLYTARELLARDFDGTLAGLAAIGYQEVEFADYFGRAPAAVREALERAKLTAPSTHFDYAALTANREALLDTAARVGHRYVTAAWIDVAERRTIGDWTRIGTQLNRLGERTNVRGMRFAVHTHDYLAKPVDGQVPLELLLAQTDPALVSFQLDVYWIVAAGADPLSYVTRYPARFPMLHVKDSAGPPAHAQVDLGAGIIDFAAILRADADASRTIEHVFVEHDEPADAMAFAKKSFDHLKALEF